MLHQIAKGETLLQTRPEIRLLLKITRIVVNKEVLVAKQKQIAVFQLGAKIDVLLVTVAIGSAQNAIVELNVSIQRTNVTLGIKPGQIAVPDLDVRSK